MKVLDLRKDKDGDIVEVITDTKITEIEPSGRYLYFITSNGYRVVLEPDDVAILKAGLDRVTS